MAANVQQRFEVKAFDVDYRRAGQEVWQARIFQPVGPGPFPVVLQVHGGAWYSGDRMSNRDMNEMLAATGMVVASIDFRVPPADPYPASVQDVNYATRWLKAHAADFDGDAREIGVRGASSGGHLAMLSALRPRDARYAALPLV